MSAATSRPSTGPAAVGPIFVTTYALAYMSVALMLIAPLLVTLALKIRSLVGAEQAPENLALVTGIGGLLSLVAYAIVLWAQSFGNLALVAALRETSVLFAGIIAAVLFKERQTRVQAVALVLAAAGIVLVKVA